MLEGRSLSFRASLDSAQLFLQSLPDPLRKRRVHSEVTTPHVAFVFKAHTHERAPRKAAAREVQAPGTSSTPVPGP